ncbi:hypothetical protein G7B40_006240 [Aetokthonos hydrillicola Thurmond2011]|jgi:hypothetical protein|uniref:Uncharacterized protein n=1 Tax=Aetokthonos hydrillicola Thurmond2011 TaxID=2712845 RepID=A0AAP5M3U5_9CYAN|nr:hypothetical protein [Aetokthonos hydrillicola]MBO3463998.1 hypothetical protein [Aetokthonos hydrillicola CCALA 1050]MBW4585070.1 hypothetical protein [Aetokthonos hydrillicola CCALA 1050]MDR9894171.1 hypothetical protein [Aetokthonos hydrillicola Thurmond2011]
MLSQAMDLVFTDSLAFAINVTLGTVVQTKLCNYSWEQKVTTESTTEQISDSRSEKVIPEEDSNFSNILPV